MKYFHKLFFSILLILTLAVTGVECAAVSFSLDNAFSRERSKALSQHQLVKYSIQAAVLSAEADSGVSAAELTLIGEKAAALAGSDCGLSFSSADGTSYYASLSASPAAGLPPEGEVAYHVASGTLGETLLQVESRFSQSGHDFVLATAQPISDVFREADGIRTACTRIYLGVLGFGMLAAFLLAWWLTRPIASLQRASRAIAAGDYQIRADVRSRDELRELAESFNQMAATVEEKIRELEDAAERQKTFTSNFAHELKTPMTSIIGYADTIYQKELSPEQVRQGSWYILNEAMRLEALSFKLMDLLNLDRGSFILEQMDAQALLGDVRASILPAAQKRGVSVQGSFAPGWVRVEYDLFKTLLMNLLDNALKSGGTTVGLYGVASGGLYRISVVDNGRGIPEAELRRITEAFYMVDKSRSRKEHGAGLGLALSARIAEIHHTKLEYASRPETGTMVTVALQLEAGDEENTEDNTE